MDRRTFLKALGAGGAAIGALAACSAVAPTAAAPAGTAATGAGGTAAAPGTPADPKVIRLSSVVIPQESGLYAYLLPEFEKRAGYRVEVSTAQDVYGPARTGAFDVVLSHYQHEGLLPFMNEGFGEFPRLVFSSPGVLIGPAADPAAIRGATDVVDAFARIARSGATFVVNDQDGLRYVAEVARRAADLPPSDRFVDKGTRGPDALRAAVQAGGYTMWGLMPFLRMKRQQPQLALEALFTRDQLLKSAMVTTVVRGEKVPGVNTTGARALQQFLAEPATQARIRTFRMEGFADQVWWPAAHDNDSAFAHP
jgi:tungstate transport system substrate-binding protein